MSNKFMCTFANIYNNENLRDPQVNAYARLYEHFVADKKTTHALIVLPTGVGKTGVMAMAPYQISKGRVLIILPRVAIRNDVSKAIDPLNPGNFYIKQEIIQSISQMPAMIEYTPDLPDQVLVDADIIVVNVHKLQKRLERSLINRVPNDFFDMIIIDEAHHSTAASWTETIEHFNTSKIIKLTGTPFRSDGEKIEGELVYNYKLSSAMAEGYIKSLSNLDYIPDLLTLTIDDDDKEYTVDELYEQGIGDELFVSRSVALSPDCSSRIVDESLKLLDEKRAYNGIPHKIIAVACSIKHARDIQALYEARGYRVAILHSGLDEPKLDEAYKSIDNNLVDVVVNVEMLGEGYDHPYLSIAAIFRPFRSELPYIQFIGRIMRLITDENASANDNIGHIIAHHYLYLDELWKKYQKEIDESIIIKELLQDENYQSVDDDSDSESSLQNIISLEDRVAKAKESSTGIILTDNFMDTEMLEKAQQIKEAEEMKVKQLMKLLDIPEPQARDMIKSSYPDVSKLRPDLLYKHTKSALDKEIRYVVVPELINEYQLTNEILTDKLHHFFNDPKYLWISREIPDTAGRLASMFNTYLKYTIGLPRKDWSQEHYKIAYQKLEDVVEYIKISLT